MGAVLAAFARRFFAQQQEPLFPRIYDARQVSWPLGRSLSEFALYEINRFLEEQPAAHEEPIELISVGETRVRMIDDFAASRTNGINVTHVPVPSI